MNETEDQWASACASEIEELHRFFQDWYNADLPNNTTTFDRFDRVLAEDFAMIVPDGRVFNRRQVIDLVRDGYASMCRSGESAGDHSFQIDIRNVHVLHIIAATHVLVGYEEWQRVPEEDWTGRLSTVLMQQDESSTNNLRWLHVHETWLPRSAVHG